MDKNINTIIKKYSDKADLMNSLVVTAFLRCHHLEAGAGFLAQFVDFKHDVETLPCSISLEDVITIFELAIPGAERTSNGAVYTPSYIRNYIVGQVLHSAPKSLDTCLCADISCGCGAFLYTLAETIHERTQAPFAFIYHHLYGVDISEMDLTGTPGKKVMDNVCFIGSYVNTNLVITTNESVWFFDQTPDCRGWRVGGCRAYILLNMLYGPYNYKLNDDDGVEQLMIAPDDKEADRYDLQGRKLSSIPTKGIYIQNGKKYVVR